MRSDLDGASYPEFLALLTHSGRRKLFIEESSVRIAKRKDAQSHVSFEGLSVEDSAADDKTSFASTHKNVQVGALKYALHDSRQYFDKCYQGSLTDKASGEGAVSVVATLTPDRFLVPTQRPVTTLQDRTLVECLMAVVQQAKAAFSPSRQKFHFTIRVHPPTLDAPPP